MRRLLLVLSESERLRLWLSRSKLSRRAARRFVAGEILSEAIEATRVLNAQGIEATLDHLGENTRSPAEARSAADEYLGILDAINKNHLRSHASLKLTQMGLDVDEGLCYEHVARIVERARDYGNFVRIDMESSAYTDRTLALYERLRDAGHQQVGLVIQAYLRRSEADIKRLMARGVSVRLCKGAYAEPPALAFASKHEVNENYRRLLSLLLSKEALTQGTRTAIATHDETLIAWARRWVDEHAIPREAFEFQMLYGIRRDLQQELTQAGYRVRVYVSYGQHWYPYFMRRLAERPANIFFLLHQLPRG
jgi:proline dehydrogenase